MTKAESHQQKFSDLKKILKSQKIVNQPILSQKSEKLFLKCFDSASQLQSKSDNRKPDIRKNSISGQKQLLYKVQYLNPDIK
jgi:predicted restriction endonuclease